MKSKTKTLGVIGIGTAAAITAFVVTTKDVDKSKLETKPGYSLTRQPNGQYTLYRERNGKNVLFATDLPSDRVDVFLKGKNDQAAKETPRPTEGEQE